MKENGILIVMAIMSMIFILLSVVGKGSISVGNIIAIIMDITVIALCFKRQ